MSERKPLTLEELRKMDGKPAYWLDDDSYGIISVESYGRWADVPFFRGRKNGVNFEYNIKSRRIEVYAVEPLRLDRSAWEPCEYCGEPSPHHDCVIDGNVEQFLCSRDGLFGDAYINTREINYCPFCGKPLTDAVWEMPEKRLEGKK